MSEELKNSILELLRESRTFNRNDVLVHADPSSRRLLFGQIFDSFAKGDFPSVILKETLKNKKESGVNTLCLADGFLISGDAADVRTPVLLTPVSFREDKVRNLIIFEIEEELAFVNPYVEHLVHEAGLEIEQKEREEIFRFLGEKGFKLETDGARCLGNFHHHRYSVLKELEELLASEKYSDPLQALFGLISSSKTFENLRPDILFPSDKDHERVFREFSENQLVIQGPPGTGKSQVLTNLIGKLLADQKVTLVLSEKFAALDVIRQKLQEFNLDKLAYISTSDAEVHGLLQELRENWNYFEQAKLDRIPNIRLSEQYEDQLQFSLDVLNQPGVVGGISLYAFKKLLEDTDLSAAKFVSNPTDLNTYSQQEETIREIYTSNLNATVGLFKRECILRDDFERLDVFFKELHDSLTMLQNAIPFETWGGFLQMMKQSVVCQILENDLYKRYSPLYKPKSKAQNKFIKLRRRYHAISKELSALESQPSHWLLQPSKEEFDFLTKLLSKNSFTARLKFKKHWKKYSRLPDSEAENALSSYNDIQEKKALKSQIIVDFCDLGIDNPEIELDLLHASIHQLGEEQWLMLSEIPVEKRTVLTSNHQLISDCYHGIKNNLQPHSELHLIEAFDRIRNSFGTLVSQLQKIKNLDDVSLQLLADAPDFRQHKACIVHSHWMLFQQRFPGFAQFEMSVLYDKATSVRELQQNESRDFANNILKSVQEQFEAFHELLNTPAKKLTESDKIRKQRLKKGKSLLVKEFSKSRNHPSMRELFASEAREWIQLLKPIWLSNPTQIAKSFPLEPGLFEVAIFDEASQIPLQNALGALQRVNHGVIAGDAQQMGPTAYFKSGSTDVIDLLHQASFYWKTCSLKHHYRSVHPELISFSNQHFYKNELKAFPAFNSQKPIRSHIVSEGIFEDRKNEEEARNVAKFIRESLQQNSSLGIVAFSEEQLQCIWKHLDAPTQQKLTELSDSGDAFFKALENVQGDECDHLIISFGYGKNAAGEFSMRFGPMNTSNGRRRLNVLLTRARKQLDFFHSVKSSDFKLSDNESINLLRLWFVKMDSLADQNTALILPFPMKSTIDKNVLILSEPHLHLNEARELVTFQSVMESRGWKVNYA